MGIAPNLLHRIFEPFQRANGDASIKGLGVGLFITKQIATSHGGSIAVESKLGKGTSFTLKLPLSTQAPGKLQI
jgi:signal transduction histidine kinase